MNIISLSYYEIPQLLAHYRSLLILFFFSFLQRLQSRYDETYPSFSEGAEEKHVWTVKALEERLPNVDLILDLTATDRYYNPNKLSKNIRHDKIKTKGHVVPDHQVIKRYVFFNIYYQMGDL